jgi:hypothetical protein
MTWLTPTIAIIAGAIAVPTLLVLYFLKLRRRDLEVSTTLLWKKSIQDLQANAPFQKLRRNILLLLQLLALAAALTALAQPQIQSDAERGTRHIILIDRSASMSARDGDPEIAPSASAARTRLEEAKRQALELVESLREPSFFDAAAGHRSGDEAMVIAFDTVGEVLQNFTSSKADLRRAIESIQPSDAPSAIASVFKLAKAYVPRGVVENLGFVSFGEPAVIHVFSDGRLPDAGQAEAAPEDKVLFHAIGRPDTPNIAITALRADRAFDNPRALSIFVGVQSTDTQPREVDAELSIDGRAVAVRAITLPAAHYRTGAEASPETGEAQAVRTLEPGAGGVVFQLDRPEAGIAAVRLRPTQGGTDRLDALAVDDLAYVVIPPARRLTVAVVTRGNLFLRECLEGLNLSRLRVIDPAVFQQTVEGKPVSAAGGPMTLGDFDVIILDRTLPEVETRDAAGAVTKGPGLPPGRLLVLGAVPPPPVGLIDEGPGEAALMVDWSRDNPALKYAGLADLVIAKSRKVSVVPGSPVTVLASDQNGPAIVEAADGITRALIVPFDPGESDWPLKPGFVLFLASSLSYLADDGASAVGRLVQPGQTLAERLPIGATNVRIAPPQRDAPVQDLFPAADGRIAYGPLRSVGIYTISWTGPAGSQDIVLNDEGGSARVRRAVAVNLLDPAESIINAADTLPLASAIVEAQQREQGRATRNLWPWLLVGALAIIMLEWFVYNRKVHV